MKTTKLGIPNLSLRSLKAALLVTRFHNVTKTATHLNRSQTAVTKSINQLEAALGKSLFDRSAHGMTPTVYGEAIAERMNRVELLFRDAGQRYLEYSTAPRSPESIAVFSMDVSHKRLGTIIDLHESRDIATTAEHLSLTRAAVYNSIRSIEGLLEMPLFRRDPTGLLPTTYCTVLVERLNLAFSEIRHAIEDIEKIDGKTLGAVVVGTLPYTRTFLTPRAINRLLERHPSIDLRTLEGPYTTMEASLRRGDIDLIVGAIRPVEKTGDTKTEILFSDELSIIVRADHPLIQRKGLKLSDLKTAQWVLPVKLTPTRKLFDSILASNGMPPPEHAVETSSSTMIRGLLMDSNRIALLSTHQIHYDKQAGLLDALPIRLEKTSRPIGITSRANTSPSPATELFIQTLREVAKELKPN